MCYLWAAPTLAAFTPKMGRPGTTVVLSLHIAVGSKESGVSRRSVKKLLFSRTIQKRLDALKFKRRHPLFWYSTRDYCTKKVDHLLYRCTCSFRRLLVSIESASLSPSIWIHTQRVSSRLHHDRNQEQSSQAHHG
jgi:hypothetical protein